MTETKTTNTKDAKQQIKAQIEVLTSSKKTNKTNANRFLEYGLESKYTKKAIVEKVFNDLKTEGVGLNIKNKQIKKPNLVQQINAFFKCIEIQRKGWWSNYNIEYLKDNVVKITKKQ
jgi:hypothetical protein